VRSAGAGSRIADHAPHVVSSTMQYVPPVADQPPYLLFLAKIVQSIAVIVFSLNVLHVRAAMTSAVIAGAATVAAVMVVVTGVVTDVIAAGKS